MDFDISMLPQCGNDALIQSLERIAFKSCNLRDRCHFDETPKKCKKSKQNSKLTINDKEEQEAKIINALCRPIWGWHWCERASRPCEKTCAFW